MSSGALEDLLEEARRAGRVESVGQFTLDLSAALQKLRGFQLENQYHYVNRLVRSAALAGAHRVQIASSASRTRAYYPRPALEPQGLETLFERIFQSARPAALELATATNLALALTPPRMEVRLDDGKRARVLVIQVRKNQGPSAEVYESAPVGPGTTFQLNRSLGEQASHWGTQSPEYLAVVRRFRFSPLAIEINGRMLERTSWWGAGGAGWLRGEETIGLRPGFFSVPRLFHRKHHAVELRLYHPEPELNSIGLPPSRATGAVFVHPEHRPDGPERCYLAIGIGVDPKGPSQARLVYQGETLQVFPVRLPLPGVELLLSAGGLTLDLSGEKVTQDEAFETRWQEARGYFFRLYEALTRAYPGVRPRDRVRKALFDPEVSWRHDFRA